jgi:hypothetical protein
MFDPEQKLIILGIIAAAVVVVCSAFAFALMRIGTHAFTGGRPEAPQVFGLFFQELPRITTIVFIVVSAVGLAGTGVVSAEACMALLGSIAGYILGGQSMPRRDAARRDSASRDGSP